MIDGLPPEGGLGEIPLPRVLIGLWSAERTGRLEIRTAEGGRILHLLNGDVVVEREGLAERDFLAALAKKKVLSGEQARQCARQARSSGQTILRTLGELGLLSPLPLWNLMESYYARRIFPLFDQEEGRWSFEGGDGLPVRSRLGLLPVPALVLQGIRQMQNAAFIDRFLPEDGAPIRVDAPARLHEIDWEPHERYALQVLGSVPHLKAFHEACEIGRPEARKPLFAFFSLGLLAPAEGKPKARPAGEPAAVGAGLALETLNEKCAFLYRYVTKEIGPLARTIILRALEEIKPGLGPHFHEMTLLADGRIEADTAVSHKAGHLPEELTRGLLRGYEEILVAEVLAVKKALGPKHETALVKALEKIGCL